MLVLHNNREPYHMHVAGDLAKMRYAASKSISISIIVLVFVTFPVVGDFDSGSEPE